jgi:hypothetical protein
MGTQRGSQVNVGATLAWWLRACPLADCGRNVPDAHHAAPTVGPMRMAMALTT